ncbi:VOC family protein [Mesorhizobium tamadayense]|uniref:VOC family protein n=1 Tax=Mesorhizobium tamadayense TaxID=425306 RepID=A0A3P3G4W4_9HYPH|nr:VOC family protein [Mesorhizobium tamadayense]RRI05906.1 VOC family protein [Mesorhizobium tamadayense]
MAKVTSHLWFEKDARQAVEFYVATIPNSAIGRATDVAADNPSGPAGSVKIIEFVLDDQNFIALEAGPLDPFNHSFSVLVELDGQDEIDRIWNAFLDNGGKPEQCGWLKDRWGLSWQIVPKILGDMAAHPDRERSKRAMEAMLGMVKIDVAALERAFGETDFAAQR